MGTQRVLLIGFASTLGLIGVCFATLPATMPAQDIEALFNARAKQVRSVLIHFTMNRRSNTEHVHNVKDITMSWDLAGDRINATAVGTVASKPFIAKWIRSNTDEWHAQPEDIQNDGRSWVPGQTWYVTHSTPKNSSTPARIDEVNFGIAWLKEAIVPFNMLHKDDLAHENVGAPEIKRAAAPSHTTCVYNVTSKDGSTMGRITYELDLSDGLRILSCTLSGGRRGAGPTVAERLLFSDYHKSNGIWFPYGVIDELFDINGKVKSTTTLTVKEVKVNVKFGASMFKYHPTFGSRVEDERNHTHYRVGMGQAASAPSHPASAPSH